MRSAIILVGGDARRAGGQAKYFFSIRGKTFIERLLETLQRVVGEIIIVAKDPLQCAQFSRMEGVQCVSDVKKGIGPIGGLHAGMLHATGDTLFVAACDMPCINRDVVEHLFTLINDYDAVVPCWDMERFEPLHAVYRRVALARYLEGTHSQSLRAMVQSMRALYVPVDNLKRYDPMLLTFTNINRLEDLDRVRSLLEGGGGGYRHP